ncbi:RNA polymerase III C11 subunit, variant 2 [Entomophthora muscae]|uniref:RNA polymerase III C11 subunit, variant 2 n=1 Tax=Entomophthora muscae TaxID=34485 RepID=A0ACC2URE8_9FUNG|nr:RNA polymerase III C11 subunit, variant 2 [Entomophthora muscae]
MYVSRNVLKRKEVDDVLGGDKAWDNVDQTEAFCPKCEHTRAFFFQLQIRSADEPMSTFYKCADLQCGHRWTEK